MTEPHRVHIMRDDWKGNPSATKRAAMRAKGVSFTERVRAAARLGAPVRPVMYTVEMPKVKQ